MDLLREGILVSTSVYYALCIQFKEFLRVIFFFFYYVKIHHRYWPSKLLVRFDLREQ